MKKFVLVPFRDWYGQAPLGRVRCMVISSGVWISPRSFARIKRICANRPVIMSSAFLRDGWRYVKVESLDEWIRIVEG